MEFVMQKLVSLGMAERQAGKYTFNKAIIF